MTPELLKTEADNCDAQSGLSPAPLLGAGRPYYSDEWVTLYHADSYAVELPACDLLLTDPPYELTATGGGIGAKRKYLADIAGKIDEGFNMELLAAFPNWVVFCGKQQLQRLLAATGDRRWSLVTWNKTNPTPLVNANYLPDAEYIVHAYQSGRLFGEYRDRSRFIVHPAEQNGYDHPTVKPMAVVSKMVRLGSQPGEIILDRSRGQAQRYSPPNCADGGQSAWK